MTTSLAIPALPTSVSIGQDWIQQRDQLITAATGIIVTDELQFAKASELLQQITRVSNALEKFRKQFADPFAQTAKAIKQMADDARLPLESIKVAVNKAISAYAEVQRRLVAEQRRKADADAQAAAQAQLAEREETSELFGAEAAPQSEIVAVPAYVAPRAINSAVKITTRPVWEVVDEDSVPVAFKMIDERKLNAYIRDNNDMIKARLEKDPAWTFAPGIVLKLSTTASSR